MGFRFRRSIKLMPGVRLNVSTRGGSLSLGGRGATLNLSSRGTRTTLGIPGTGLSYVSSSRAGSAPRRASTAQLAAQARRIEQEQDRARALAEIERIEAELRDTLGAWRASVVITPEQDVRAGLARQPFQSDEAPPGPPDYDALAARCRAEARELVRRAHPLGFGDRLKAVVGGLVGAVLAGLASPVLTLLAAPLCGWLTWLFVVSRWEQRLAPLEAERAQGAWATLQPETQRAYSQECERYAQRLEAGQHAFHDAEAERIALLAQVLQGDPEAIELAVSAHVAELDFPFETECRVAVDDEDLVLIDLDLPEIEDVIPETEYKVLKNGQLKASRRKAAERNTAYAELVCGLTLAVGAAALSAAPTLAAVTLAARTQRQKRASVEIEDAYVIEVKLSRSALRAVQGGTVDPVEFISRAPSRMVVLANGGLKKIPAPAWAGGFTG